MEVHILPQRESVGQAVGADGPVLGDAGLRLQLFVQLHEPVVELRAAPDDGLVLGESRVERGNPRRLVVPEYHLVAVVRHAATR